MSKASVFDAMPAVLHSSGCRARGCVVEADRLLYEGCVRVTHALDGPDGQRQWMEFMHVEIGAVEVRMLIAWLAKAHPVALWTPHRVGEKRR